MRRIGRFIFPRTRCPADLGIERVELLARDQLVDLLHDRTVDDIDAAGRVHRATAPFDTAGGGGFRNGAVERRGRELALVAIAGIVLRALPEAGDVGDFGDAGKFQGVVASSAVGMGWVGDATSPGRCGLGHRPLIHGDRPAHR